MPTTKTKNNDALALPTTMHTASADITAARNTSHKHVSRKGLPAAVAIGTAVLAGTAAAAGVLLAKRHVVRTTCKPFYSDSERLFKIPGLDAGFVPQDLFYLEEEDVWLFSGYMDNRKPSPLYKVLSDGTVCRHEVRLLDGTLYKGHGAAIAATDQYVFLTVKDGYVAMDRKKVVAAPDGEVISTCGHRKVSLRPAFMNVQKDMLYIGEFRHRLFYPTPKSHWLKCPSGETNKALVYAYEPSDNGPFGFGKHPSVVYSIPGNVQGLCITPDGNIAVSLAWGLGNAQVRIYDPAKAHRSGSYAVDGHKAALYFLDNATLEQTLTVPPMAEGMDCHDGHIYLANESASNLYVLGKFYDGQYVYSFPVE